jgi:hypothetical protein
MRRRVEAKGKEVRIEFTCRHPVVRILRAGWIMETGVGQPIL